VKQERKPFQRTVATPRIDPDFDNWMEAWTPRSVQERQRMRPDA
jgi:hypothetical protein